MLAELSGGLTPRPEVWRRVYFVYPNGDKMTVPEVRILVRLSTRFGEADFAAA